jgi:Leucine-rich repeat (LRR) protein
MENMTSLLLNGNKFTGTIPSDLLPSWSSSMERLDISSNSLTGTIPTVIGKMTKLERFDAQNNFLEGSLPVEMNRMYPDIQLNLTNNL